MRIFIVSLHDYDYCGWPTHDVEGVYDTLEKAVTVVNKSGDRDRYDIDEYEVNGNHVGWHMERGSWMSDELRKMEGNYP